MRGIRFINEICKEFNLKITVQKSRNSLTFYNLNNDRYLFCFHSNHIVFWIKRRELYYSNYIKVKAFEKYKIFQLIYDDLCEEKDLSKK